jgi:hypothetical protein
MILPYRINYIVYKNPDFKRVAFAATLAEAENKKILLETLPHVSNVTITKDEADETIHL